MRRRSIVAMALLLASIPAAFPAAAGDPGKSPAEALPASAPGGASWIDFTLPDMNGDPVALGRFIGKTPVLLAFWATWCPHCNETVPEINRLHAASGGGDRLQILALNYKESDEKVGAFLRRKKVVYPVLLDRKGTAARMYRVVGIPTYVLIDKAGRIVYRGHELPETGSLLQ